MKQFKMEIDNTFQRYAEKDAIVYMPENLLPLKDKIKVLCYPAVWNRDCKELDEVRIERFEDILKYFKDS